MRFVSHLSRFVSSDPCNSSVTCMGSHTKRVRHCLALFVYPATEFGLATSERSECGRWFGGVRTRAGMHSEHAAAEEAIADIQSPGAKVRTKLTEVQYLCFILGV